MDNGAAATSGADCTGTCRHVTDWPSICPDMESVGDKHRPVAVAAVAETPHYVTPNLEFGSDRCKVHTINYRSRSVVNVIHIHAAPNLVNSGTGQVSKCRRMSLSESHVV